MKKGKAMPDQHLTRTESRLICLLAYLVAAAVAFATGRVSDRGSLLWTAAAADLAATIVVFVFSLILDNSSVYDPYWSVAPVPILVYWLAATGDFSVRRVVVLALVVSWAVRLTMNWLRRWRGLADEDWRYADYRKLGSAYWPVSFLGFHLFPTVIVFLGCMALLPVFLPGARQFGVLDALAAVVTLGAVVTEATADFQLRKFLLTRTDKAQVLDTGLWALSRHPNYFGEVMFWWGLWLFGLAADPSWWWTIAGPVTVTGLFLGVSIPMMDTRLLSRHPGYAELIGARSAFVPLPQLRSRSEERRTLQ
jgi:steroid 5-alpha reductase family enzyme